MPTTIYVASAGTGKTTTLMKHLQKALETTKPERIMFTTFTNAGADEIINRTIENHPEYIQDDFKWFRTMHSIAYRNIPYRRMINRAELIAFGKQCGYPISGAGINKQEGFTDRLLPGDVLVAMDNYMRSTLQGAKAVAGLQTTTHFDPQTIDSFSEAYRKYRKALRKYDFTDQLEVFRNILAGKRFDIDWLFVDEAQDLSALQWAIVEQLSKQVRQTVVAGDDKQSIFKFAGADPHNLIQLSGERVVLGQSYRLPTTVLEYAEKLAERITEKQDYQVKPAADGGSVQTITTLKQLDLSKGTWFLLARNRKFLPVFEQEVMKMGYLFESDGDSAVPPQLMEAIQQWLLLIDGHEIEMRVAQYAYNLLPVGTGVKRGFKKVIAARDPRDMVSLKSLIQDFGLVDPRPPLQSFKLPEYLRDLLKLAGDQLQEDLRIKISTIHGVKGMEADNVVILPDMTNLTYRNLQQDPDSEHRVFYVAATRAKQNLFIHKPLTNCYYDC